MSDRVQDVPTGTVTFLFSDVVGSTRLWATDAKAMAASLTVHDQIFDDTAHLFDGQVFAKAGDSYSIAFSRASAAVQCAAALKQALAGADWGGAPGLSVRIGLHLGEAEERDANYFGPTVNLAARVMAIGNGGQCLLTDAVRDAAGVATRDVGTYTLRDIEVPVHLSQLGDDEFPPIGTAIASLVALPSPRTSLIGREPSVEEIRKLMRDNRLVTLTGVGGCGKTRLAIEVAHREMSSHPGGTWFVDLSTIADKDALPGAVASTLKLNVAAAIATEDQIIDYLAPREALLVVDNCEHVIDAAAAFIDNLLERSPRLRILATSRESLELDGEFAWKVPSLSLGDDSPAAQLFFDRAIAAGGEVVRDEPTTTIVADIVERLDGIPLAIELAAARTRSLELSELASRLDDRFRLLSGASRRSRQRQATLEAAVQWSYDLLNEPEQSMLKTLSVFQGGFDVADTAAISGLARHEAEDLIDSLVAKSLVDIQRHGTGELRHRLLETIRLFVLGRLIADGVAASMRDAHLHHFAHDPQFACMDTWSARACVDRVGREFENLRAAVAWALETDRRALAVRLAAIASDAAPPRGDVRWALDCLRLPVELEPGERVRVKTMLGWNLTVQGDVISAAEALHEAITTAEHHHSDFVVLAIEAEATRLVLLGDIERRRELIAMAQSTADAQCGRNCQALAAMFTVAYLVSVLRYEEAVTLANSIMAGAPEFGWLHVVEAFRAWALLQLGKAEEAARAVSAFSPIPTGSQWGHLNLIVDHAVRGHTESPESAGWSLANVASELVARVPQIASDILVCFAYLHHLRGEGTRMEELLSASAPMAAESMLIALLAKARGLTADEADRLTEQYYTQHPVPQHFLLAAAEAPRLLAEEFGRWA